MSVSHTRSLTAALGHLTLASTASSQFASSSSSSSCARLISTTARCSEEGYAPPRPTQVSRRPPMSNQQRQRPTGASTTGGRRRPGMGAGPFGGAARGGRRGGRGGDGERSRLGRRSSAPQSRATKLDEDTTFLEWYRGVGFKQFAEPPKGQGPFWIGATPFPLNPSFNPPPPVSQQYKDAMWALHVQNPDEYNMRFLSQHFGLTMERTHAVLRLKALESEMQSRRVPLQHDFQANMERLIGSRTRPPPEVRKPKQRQADALDRNTKDKDGMVKDKDEAAEAAEAASAEASDALAESFGPRFFGASPHESPTLSLQEGLAAGLKNRGPMTEDVTSQVTSSGGAEGVAAESDDLTNSTESVLLPALAKQRQEQRAKDLATPLGGPDLAFTDKGNKSPQSRIYTSKKRSGTSSMTILDLKDARQEVNYKGTGHLDQNRRKVERRQKAAARREEARQARAARREEFLVETASRLAAERDEDYEEVLASLRAEQQKAEEKKVTTKAGTSSKERVRRADKQITQSQLSKVGKDMKGK